MAKTLLVIGNVSAKQYHEARLGILHKGDKPRVHRIAAKNFFLVADDLATKHGTPEIIAKFEDKNGMPLTDEERLFLAEKHLEPFASVGAVVMDEPSWRLWPSGINQEFGLLVNVLRQTSVYLELWVAYPDGRYELVDY